MKFFILLPFFVLGIGSEYSTVFLCNNGTTNVYHLYESCGAYQKCTHQKKKISKSEAIQIGLRACKSPAGCGKR